MTRSLRKRHLILWVIITLVVGSLIVYARVNVPQFQGDEATNTIDQ